MCGKTPKAFSLYHSYCKCNAFEIFESVTKVRPKLILYDFGPDFYSCAEEDSFRSTGADSHLGEGSHEGIQGDTYEGDSILGGEEGILDIGEGIVPETSVEDHAHNFQTGTD